MGPESRPWELTTQLVRSQQHKAAGKGFQTTGLPALGVGDFNSLEALNSSSGFYVWPRRGNSPRIYPPIRNQFFKKLNKYIKQWSPRYWNSSNKEWSWATANQRGEPGNWRFLSLQVAVQGQETQTERGEPWFEKTEPRAQGHQGSRNSQGQAPGWGAHRETCHLCPSRIRQVTEQDTTQSQERPTWTVLGAHMGLGINQLVNLIIQGPSGRVLKESCPITGNN